jgi:hypothetical protein
MPIDKSRVDKLITMMDNYLRQLEQDPEDEDEYELDEDQETDPVQFGNPPRTLPIAEPANISVDSPPAQIHKSKDLFS